MSYSTPWIVFAAVLLGAAALAAAVRRFARRTGGRRARPARRPTTDDLWARIEALQPAAEPVERRAHRSTIAAWDALWRLAGDAPGGPERFERLHAAGRLTARQLAAIVDLVAAVDARGRGPRPVSPAARPRRLATPPWGRTAA